MSRSRTFLLACWLFLLPGALVLAASDTAENKGTNELVILHTNDLHTHFAGNDKKANACNKEKDCQGGYGQIASRIEEIKKEHPNVLLLDAGDRLQGSLAYTLKKWQSAVDFEKFLPFDVVTLGNHEYDEGCDELAKYIEASGHKVVAANIKETEEGPINKNNVAPYEIKDFGKFKVGVVGLANSKISSSSTSCKNLVFTDPEKAAQEAINDLKKQGVGLIIVLSHLGIEKDIELASELRDADIIVGGHSHKYIGEGSAIGPYPFVLDSPEGRSVLMVTTNGLARYLGDLRLELAEDGSLQSWKGNLTRLSSAGGQKEISTLIDQYYKQIQEMLKQPVFINKVDSNDGFDACRHGPCLTASLMADVMLKYAKQHGAQIALINGGTVRNGLPVGMVTQGDLLSAMPFGDIVVLKELKGSEILQALEHGVSDLDGVGPWMLHASGLKYSFKPNATEGRRLVKAEAVLPDGKTEPIDPNKQYIVAITEFLSDGGDGQIALKESKTLKRDGVKVKDLITKEFKKGRPLNKDYPPDIEILN